MVSDTVASSRWILIAASFLASAVILGAFGAHALKEYLGEYEKAIYEKAAFYHFIHALGILFVAILPRLALLTELQMLRVCRLLCLGIIIFSGSLYALALSGIRFLGAITPIGGSAFIVAWGLLGYYAYRMPHDGGRKT